MENTMKKFGNVKTKKQKFYQYKRLNLIDNIGVSKIVSFVKNRFKYRGGYRISKFLNKFTAQSYLRYFTYQLTKYQFFQIN